MYWHITIFKITMYQTISNYIERCIYSIVYSLFKHYREGIDNNNDQLQHLE